MKKWTKWGCVSLTALLLGCAGKSDSTPADSQSEGGAGTSNGGSGGRNADTGGNGGSAGDDSDNTAGGSDSAGGNGGNGEGGDSGGGSGAAGGGGSGAGGTGGSGAAGGSGGSAGTGGGPSVTSAVTQPTVAMNDDGTAVVVWVRQDEELSGGDAQRLESLWSSRYTPAGGWSRHELISDGGLEMWSPSVALDAAGNAMVTWTDLYDPVALAAYYRTGTGWEAPEEMGVFYPALAMSAGGSAIVRTVTSENPTSANHWTRRFTPDDGWGTRAFVHGPRKLEDSGGSMLMDAAGNAMLGGRPDDDSTAVFHSSAEADLAWTVSLETGALPHVAMDPEGDAVAVWPESESEWRSSRYTVGVGWGETEVIEGVGADDRLHELGMDGDGNVIALWERLAGASAPYNELVSNRHSADSGWGAMVQVSSPLVVSGAVPSLAVGGAGDAVVVWTQEDQDEYYVCANRYTPGTGWGEAEVVDATTPAVFSPQVAIDGDGNAIVVWANSEWTTPEAATWSYWMSSPSE